MNTTTRNRFYFYTALFVAAIAVFSLDAQACPKGARCGQTVDAAIAPVVNVNTATAEQLAFLPGVGPKIAAAIIEKRAEGLFLEVDHLTRVKWIGDKKLAAMRPYVVLAGETTATKKIRVEKGGEK